LFIRHLRRELSAYASLRLQLISNFLCRYRASLP
jgi:hypothetical protein